MLTFPAVEAGCGTCCKCGAKTKAKMIAYCSVCYKKEEKRQEAKEAKEIVRSLYENSRIPPLYRETSLYVKKTPSMQKKTSDILKKQIESYCNKGSWKLPYLHGPSGTGKTWTALAACNDLIRNKHMSAYYLHVPDIMIDRKFYEEDRHIIKQASVLVLDDIGHHNTTQYSLNLLYNIINHRMLYQKSTMIVSNFSVEALVNKITKDNEKICAVTCIALRDRIMAMCIPIEMKGRNLRLEASVKDIRNIIEGI